METSPTNHQFGSLGPTETQTSDDRYEEEMNRRRAHQERKKARMELKREFKDLRHRLAAVLRCVPSKLQDDASVVEAQRLFESDRSLSDDEDDANPDVSFYVEILDTQCQKCDPLLDVIQQRMEKLYLPMLPAEKQREWKLLFTDPTTPSQKAEWFAFLKQNAKQDRAIARRRLQNEKRVLNDKALDANNKSLALCTEALNFNLSQELVKSDGYKLSAEHMIGQLHRVHRAVKDLPSEVKLGGMPNELPSGSEDEGTGRRQRDTSTRLSNMLHSLMLDNERLQRSYEQTRARTLLYDVRYQSMKKEMKENWGTGVCITTPPQTDYFEPLHTHLENARALVESKPDPNIYHVSVDSYQPLGDYPPKETQQLHFLMKGGITAPETICREEGGWPPQLVDTLALEFAQNCMRSSVMAQLMHDLEDMNRSTNETEAFKTLSLIVEKTVQCHIARFWSPMNSGAGYFAAISGSSEVLVVNKSEKHLVCDAFASGKIQNVGDVYMLDNFDKSEDNRLGYRTRAVICVPIRTQLNGPVVAVIQCVNKIVPSASTFSDFDGFLLHVIGAAYLQVRTQLLGRMKMVDITRRKDTLIMVSEKLFSRQNLTSKDVLTTLEDCLRELFGITEQAIILCSPKYVERLRIGTGFAEVAATAPANKGLVGICIKEQRILQYKNAAEQADALTKAYGLEVASRVDLETEGRLTSWPIIDNGRVIVVIQMVQPPEHVFDHGSNVGFDGESPEQISVLRKLFAMSMYFIEKWWPQHERFSSDSRSGTVQDSRSAEKKKRSSMLLSTTRLISSKSVGLDLRSFVLFSRLLGEDAKDETWMKDVLDIAVRKIQSMYRAKLKRRRTMYEARTERDERESSDDGMSELPTQAPRLEVVLASPVAELVTPTIAETDPVIPVVDSGTGEGADSDKSH